MLRARLQATVLAVLSSAGVWPGEGEALVEQFERADPAARVALVASAAAAGGDARSEVLGRAMRDGSEAVLVAALEAVARHRVRELAGLVVQRLGDSRAAVRLAGVEAARSLRSQEASTALSRAAGDSDAAVRARALDALAALRPSAAPGAVVDRVHDDEPSVRVAAIRALGDIGDAATVLAVLGALDDPNAEVRLSAVRALGNIRDPRAIRALRGALGDGSSEVAAAAARALGAQGARAEAAVDDLAPIALRQRARPQGPPQPLVEAAIDALISIGTPRAVELIDRVIQGGRDDDLAMITATLQAAPPTLAPRLLEALRLSEHPSVTELALLGALGGPRACDLLFGALDRLRTEHGLSVALVALGQTGDPRAVSALLGVITRREDERGEARRHGARVVSSREERAGALRGLREVARRAGRLPALSFDALASSLDAPSASAIPVVVDTLALIGETRNPRAAALLSRFATQGDPRVRVAALRALARTGGGETATLVPLLRDVSDLVRLAAGEAIAAGASTASIPPLVRALSAQDGLDRATTARTLALAALRVGAADEVVSALRALLRDPSIDAVSASIDGLSRLAASGSDPALEALLGAAESSSAATGALGDALASADSPTRARIAARLRWGAPADPDSVWALRALPDSAPRLLDALSARRPSIARNAAAALAFRARSAPLRATLDPQRLCERWRASDDPELRGNLALAIVPLDAACAGEVLREAQRSDAPVALRAATWSAAAEHPERPGAREALERCVQLDPSPALARRCAAALRGVRVERGDVDLRAVGASSRSTLRLTLSDGMILHLTPRPGGWLHLTDTPVDEVRVER